MDNHQIIQNVKSNSKCNEGKNKNRAREMRSRWARGAVCSIQMNREDYRSVRVKLGDDS